MFYYEGREAQKRIYEQDDPCVGLAKEGQDAKEAPQSGVDGAQGVPPDAATPHFQACLAPSVDVYERKAGGDGKCWDAHQREVLERNELG